MITQEILNTFVYETLSGKFMVSDPLEFDQTIEGGPFETRELAESALIKYIKENEIEFE